MTSRYFLGIDSGGTTTRALMADAHGHILASGMSGSANRNHYTRDQIKENLSSAVRAAGRELRAWTAVDVVFIGTSGVSTDADRREVAGVALEIPELAEAGRVIVENDTVVGLTGGLSGRPGLVLVAGTGSACYGDNGQGDRWMTGGWGALADDAGSAPWVGLQALQAAVRGYDGRQAPTALTDVVFQFLGLSEPRALIRRVHDPENGVDRSDLGALAPMVMDCVRAGDHGARTIVEDASRALSALVGAASSRLFGDRPFEMILVGGLALSGDPFQTALVRRLSDDHPNALIREPEFTPAQGAVLEALKFASVPWTPSVLANLARPER